MAQAAAAAAAAATMQAQARKDLDSGLKIVPKLADSDIDSFQRAMKLLAYQCEWSPWILDVRLPANRIPGDARRNVRDEDSNLTTSSSPPSRRKKG